MNHYKEGRPSQATATTLCQKCLKRGHFSYECTAAQQDRPYVSRPSRTQQLSNPKLAPKITEAAPKTKESTQEEQKDQKLNNNRQRSRSVSSYSSGTDSVSTISTNRSRSRSRSPRRNATREVGRRRSPEQKPPKRRRRSSDTDSIDGGYRRTERHEQTRRSRSRDTSNYQRRDRDELPARKPASARSPGRGNGTRSRSRSPVRSGRSDYRQRSDERRTSNPQPRNRSSRERELSPYSKRVALTKAVQR